jgi:hypothetical protein
MIAVAWFNLGFRPRDSLVLLGLEGPRNRVGMLLRVDLPIKQPGDAFRPPERLPPERQQALLPHLVRDLLTTVAASGAHSVVAIVADDQALSKRAPAVVRELMASTKRLGLGLFDVFAVTETAFASLVCDDPRCCPSEGWPIEQVMTSRSAVAHVLQGDLVADSEADLLADVTPGPLDHAASPVDAPWGRPKSWGRPEHEAWKDEEREDEEREDEGWKDEGWKDEGWKDGGWKDGERKNEERTDDGQADAGQVAADRRGQEQEDRVLRQRLIWWRRWGQACAVVAGEPDRAGSLPPFCGLSAALHDNLLRDAVLIGLLGAAPLQVRAMLNGAYGGPSSSPPPADADRLWKGPGRSAKRAFDQELTRLLRRGPDQERLRIGRIVLAGAVRVAAEGDRGPALAVLAMIAWFEGQGGRARLLVERARADAASVSLIGLVEDLLVSRVPPPWRRNRPEGG